MDGVYVNSSSANQTAAHLNNLTSASSCSDPWFSMLFLIFMEILTSTVGFPANVYVIYLMVRGVVERSTSDVFTLSLAVLDASYSLSLPLHALNHYLLNQVVIAHFGFFLLGLNETGGPLFMSCICMDRYIAVAHPVTFLKFSHGHHRSVIAALMWLTTLGHALFMGWSLNPVDSMFVAIFLFSFQVIFICNIFLLRALRQSGPSREELHPIKKRAFHTVLTIFLIIIICFLPAAMVLPFRHLLPGNVFLCQVFPVCNAFITLRAALHALFLISKARKLPCTKSNDD